MDKVVEIILIEDNAFEAELAMKALSQNNFGNNVLHIDEGEEALEYIFRRGKYKGKISGPLPKLILLDLNLPKVNGLQILKEIKEDPATTSIPVVILTASELESDILKSYQLCANSYLVKPLNFQAFASAISTVGIYWLQLNKAPEQGMKSKVGQH